ncbi:DUF1642 domain-containing protein [Pediococcus pentosaceus]|uniref:DUF1642 domain-containing protein n=1 Tax=Pediococcus pentosaceus TaxID=1255 RepID=UPI001F578FA5|nr:DUF1642 domain-containing protein [Pediococcus pentosaceus]MCI2961037.1 DUF1642 domain-containing protein [Pediococcus pentosaceus]
MTKDEYTKTLKKYMADNELEQEDGLTYLDGIQEAATLARQLDEPKKVVIPQFVADWIENDLDYVGKEPVNIVRGVVEDGDCGPRGEWLDSIDNQKLLLNAIANGYEVEEDVKKEKMYRFNIPTAYKCLYDTGKEVAILPYEYDGAKSAMTMKRAKTWTYFNAYNNAGLLEFEEVEDE